MKFGVTRMLSDGTDVAIVTAGICTEEALKAKSLFEATGVSVRHLHLSTLHPFPSQAIVDAANKTKHGIVVMENHSIVGGIGSAAAEALAEHGVGKKLVRLGVPGVYAHGASRDYLIAEYGFDSHALIRAVEKLVGKPLLSCDDSGTLGQKTGKEATIPALSAEERPEDL